MRVVADPIFGGGGDSFWLAGRSYKASTQTTKEEFMISMKVKALLAMAAAMSVMDPTLGNPLPQEKEPKPAKDPNSSKLLKAEQKRARRAEKRKALNKGE